jgi:pre-mRNA-processing factor 17
MRTYLGHNKAVRDVTFNNSGAKFLSGGYDKTVKLWDTETGKCISSFFTKATPYCLKFNPDGDKQNLFLTGCSDNKILQVSDVYSYTKRDNSPLAPVRHPVRQGGARV